jgi:hypothetical protein
LDKIKNNNNMGFLTNLVSATIKTALTPVAVVKDVVNVIRDEEADSTKNLLNSVGGDLNDAADDLVDGNI